MTSPHPNFKNKNDVFVSDPTVPDRKNADDSEYRQYSQERSANRPW